MGIETLKLSYSGSSLNSRVQLTGSKSESNRALLIRALFEHVQIENLSEADDTVTLVEALKQVKTHSFGEQLTIDIGPAGTAMRFLTAYLAIKQGNYKLTGSSRMQQRPISLLVDALNSLGASITYANHLGYPPLLIQGGFDQLKEEVQIKGDVSSQYLSALMLIAPHLPKGLTIHILGDLTSKPYVSMTLSMLQEVGIDYEWKDQRIVIPNQQAKATTLYIEPDWSAASYWYSVIALSPIGSSLLLPGLKSSSLQGDRAIVEIMSNFGVRSTFTANGVKIEKIDNPSVVVNQFDLKECPDLAQTVIVCCAALDIAASFTGLETLKIKETDRIKALQNELGKFGVELLEDNQTYRVYTAKKTTPREITISTYEDHRMAMAFAPLALVFEGVHIEDPAVVGKSYPQFWEHLKQVGFSIEE